MPDRVRPGLPIPDDWNGTDWCRFSICWPDSVQWRGILAGYLTMPSRGRTWDGDTGIVTDVQQIGQEILASNLPWRYALMSSCSEMMTDFIAALNRIAVSLGQSGSGCCGGPGTPGGSGTGGSGTTGQPPAEPPAEGQPPAGFDTVEEWKVYECDVITWWVGQIGSDLDNLSTIQLVGATIVTLLPVLAALLLAPIPGPNLFAIAGILAAAAAYGWYTLDDMSAAWADSAENIKCALFNASDVNSGIAAALAEFNTAFEATTTDQVKRAYASQVIGYFLNADGYNKAWVKDETRTYPTGDCENCAPEQYPLQFVQDLGTGNLDLDDATRTLTSVWDGAEQQIYIDLDIPEGGSCSAFTIEFMADTQSLVFDCRDCANGSTASGHRVITGGEVFGDLFSIQMYATDPPANNSGTTFSISVKLRYT